MRAVTDRTAVWKFNGKEGEQEGEKCCERLLSHLYSLLCMDRLASLPQTFLWYKSHQLFTSVHQTNRACRWKQERLISGFKAV